MRFSFAVLWFGLCCVVAQSVELLWSLPLGRGAAGPPVVFAGGALVTLSDGRIVFVDNFGKETATARMEEAPMGPALVKEGAVYAADVWGSVYRFTMAGERVWKHERQTRAGSGYNTPVFTDIGVVITDTRGHLYVVNWDGKLRFELTATTYRLSTPAVGDIDGDGKPDIVFGADDGTVYCVSPEGQLIWERKLAGARFGRAMPAIADLDRDGRYEVYVTTPFVGTQTGLHSLDGFTGTPRWHVKSEMQTYASLMFLDLNGDGKKEVLFGDKNTRLYAVNAQGEKVWDTQLGGRGIFYAGVAVGDWIYQTVRDTGLDGKSLYVLDRQGKIRGSFALDGGGTYGPALTRLRGSMALLTVSNKGTVQAFRIEEGTPHWSSWRSGDSGYFAATGTTRRTVSTPRMNAKEVRTAFRGTNTVAGGTPRTLRVERPDGSIYLAIGTNSFAALEPGEYRVTVNNGRVATVYKLEDDRLALRAPPTELGDAVTARLQAEYTFATKHPTVERFDAVRARVQEAEGLFATIDGKPKADVLVRQLENPWSGERAYRDGLQVKMLGNEYEPLAFVVTNLRPETAQMRLSTEAAFLDIREVPLVRPESTGRLTEDVLPKLNQAGTVTLAPGESRKFWAIVHSRNLAAGAHTAALRVGDMHSLGRPVDVPVRVEVSKARLPEKRTYQQCQWLYLASIADPAVREATVVDALEHGMTVFPIPALSFPLTGKPDSSLHDSLIARLKGKATFLVGGSVGGPLAAQDYPEAIRRYSAHMKSLGLTYDDWAFYYMDEPGLMGKDASFDKYVAGITRVKQADPQVRIYANPAGGARPEMLAPLTKLVSVWQPDLHLVREHPEEYKKIFETGTYWHYEAPADQRNLDTLGYYRMKPWVAFQMGMTGGGYWVYSSPSFWHFDHTMSTEYGTVYQTPAGPVTTKRWEASRDGAEDFELLWQVREKARAANNTAVLQLIEVAVAYVTKGQDKVSDISRQVEPIAPDYSRWMQYRAQLISAWENML